MTTAHRPTFDPARGKDAQRGPAYHQRLLPAHTHLKQRQPGQGGAAGLPQQRDLRAELGQADFQASKTDAAPAGSITADGEAERGEKRKLDTDAEDGDVEDEEAKRRRLILEEAKDIDADSAGGSSSDESSEEEDEEDEEAELMRELAKIKAERAAAKKKEEEEQAAKDQEQREVDIARGNPLLNKQDFGLKRRWDDDVVFKNQARGTEDRGKRKEFVNDLLRSDFHKRFMVCLSARSEKCSIADPSTVEVRSLASSNAPVASIARSIACLLRYLQPRFPP